MRNGGKRFTHVLFVIPAFTQTFHQRLHSTANHLPAESEKRQCIQLTVLRQSVIRRPYLLDMRDYCLDIRMALENMRSKSQQKRNRGRDEDEAREHGTNLPIPTLRHVLSNTLHQPIRKIIRQMRVGTPFEHFRNLGIFISHVHSPQSPLIHAKMPFEMPPWRGAGAT